jgi:tRNA threonylcarbamoyladenosine biosynthesis protein TsaB
MDIDAYACTVGPGYYTGLRIGVSTTKALAYAAGKPVAGISTLAAIAWPYRCIPGLIVCSMIDARNRRLFAGAWLEDRAIIDEANCRDSDFVAALQTFITQQTEAQAVSGLLLVGHQPEAFFESSGKPLLAGTRQAPAAAALPRAAVVAEMAEIKLMQGESGSPLELLPRYLSPSPAERRKTEPA